MHTRTLIIREFEGTQKINRLPVFPMKYHPNPTQLRVDLVKRGRKWASLCGVYHVYYRGLGGKQTCNGYVRYNVSAEMTIVSLHDAHTTVLCMLGQLTDHDRQGYVITGKISWQTTNASSYLPGNFIRLHPNYFVPKPGDVFGQQPSDRGTPSFYLLDHWILMPCLQTLSGYIARRRLRHR